VKQGIKSPAVSKAVSALRNGNGGAFLQTEAASILKGLVESSVSSPCVVQVLLFGNASLDPTNSWFAWAWFEQGREVSYTGDSWGQFGGQSQ